MTPKIPLSPCEVTKEWLETALKGDNVKVQELNGVKNEGGVLSCVFKAKVGTLTNRHLGLRGNVSS